MTPFCCVILHQNLSILHVLLLCIDASNFTCCRKRVAKWRQPSRKTQLIRFIMKFSRWKEAVMTINLVLYHVWLEQIKWSFLSGFWQYHIERHLLFGKRLQASVWHSGTLKRKVFLGEILIPLDGWRFEDKASQCFNWYPLCPKVKESRPAKTAGQEIVQHIIPVKPQIIVFTVFFYTNQTSYNVLITGI